MTIAIVVHGRFHAFDLARELLALGHDVRLYTNYPRSWPARFGVPRSQVRSLTAHGIAARGLQATVRARHPTHPGESFLHRWFGRWAADQVRREPADVILCFSGVAEELLQDRAGRQDVRVVIRASSHIRAQRRILDDEAQRTGHPVDAPSDWMIARETREYALADLVITVSRFARDSFVAQGVPAEKVAIVPYGVRPAIFQVTPIEAAARAARLRSADRLRVLTVGTFSLRKGAYDYVEIARRLHDRVEFLFRGQGDADARWLYREAAGRIRFLPRVPEPALAADYRAADLFLFPTLEDGYAGVLSQAAASGLPILATTNCGAADFVREAEDGWLVPIRRPDLAVDRLTWADRHRDALAQMAEHAARPQPSRDWHARARELVALLERATTPRVRSRSS